MMRKILSLFAIASMLVATSCSNEEFDSVKNGTEANVSFTAQLPEGLQTKMTRAYGDGMTAKNLTYAVYDENWVLLPNLGNNKTMVDRKTEVNLTLVNGKTYNIVFWADSYESEATDAAIEFNQAEAKVEVDYDKITANSEELDAFFSVEEITVSGYEARDVTLKRPFAQLNIGAKDWDAMAKNGVEITKTGVKVENIYNTLDFKTGNVTGEPTSVTFTPGELPSDDVFPAGAEYTYLSMNYLLVSMDKTSDNKVTINYDGVVEEQTFESVPLQRNYRTNIFGNLLTSQSDWTVEIEEDFDGIHTYSGYGSLDEIIEKVNSGEISKIYLTEDATITADETLTGDLTIHGNGYTLTVDGYTWRGNTGTLTLNNVTVFDTESYDENGGWELTNLEINKVKATDCIFKNGLMIGSDSEFTNCSFTELNKDQYAVWVLGGDVSFADCTFQGARGLKVHNQYHDYQNGYTGTISVDNCKFFIENKPGVCFGKLQSSANVSIMNSLFVCAAGDQSMYIYETDTDITAFIFSEANNTIATAVSTTEELKNALESDENSGKTILLAATEFEEITVSKIASNLTIEGNGETTIVKGIKVEETDIENLALKGIVFKDKGMWLNFTNTPHNKVKGLTMKNCTMQGLGQDNTQDGNRLFDIGTDSFGSNQLVDITIEDCTVSDVYQGIRLGGLKGTTTIKNNAISKVGHNAITLRSTSATNSTILVENNVITNGADRAFRIGTVNAGTVTYKNNTITNTGDTDGDNFKANTINGTVIFEGNTVDGNAWGNGTYTSATSF